MASATQTQVLALRATVDNARDQGHRVESGLAQTMPRNEVQESIAKNIEDVQAAARRSEMMINSAIAHINNRIARNERAFGRLLRYMEAEGQCTTALFSTYGNRQETLRQQLVSLVMHPLNDPTHRDYMMNENVDFR